MRIQYKQSTKDSRFLEPIGDGNIDVLNMAWTLSPKSSRIEVPFVHLTEYQQTTGQLIASIIYYARIASRLVNNGVTSVIQPDKDPSEVYKYKYFAEPTGFSYRFPYFNTKKLSRNNDFTDTQGTNPFQNSYQLGREMLRYPGSSGFTENLFEGIGKIGSVGNLMRGVADTLLPGKTDFETPKSWTGTSNEEYSVTFDLFNTTTVEDIENNRNLCHLLSYQNSPSRRNFAIVDPPVIYSLTIPDVVHLPACFMSSLNITNLGNTRVMALNEGGIKRTIPEAYRITMTFTSLLLPSRNILSALDKGQVVEAISEIPEEASALFKLVTSGNLTESEKQRAGQLLESLTTGKEPFSPGSFTRDLAEF